MRSRSGSATTLRSSLGTLRNKLSRSSSDAQPHKVGDALQPAVGL